MAEQQLTFQTLGGATVTVRKRGKHYVQPRGYFHSPGTGPTGETCGGCAFAARYKRFTKCGKNRARWTRGRGSDILATAPACKYWERAK